MNQLNSKTKLLNNSYFYRNKRQAMLINDFKINKCTTGVRRHIMKIAIIGGGIGGLATAISLQKIGIKAHVYERAKSFNPLGAGIGIGSNVMRALHELNISDSILKMGIPLYEQRFLNEKFD